MDYIDGDLVQALSTPDAWEFLTHHEVGRLAYVLGRDVTIVPVNYSVLGDRLLIRTAPGSKLLGVVMNPGVAFEVDEMDAVTATSVVIRGTAEHLDEGAARATELRHPRTWVDTPKYEVVAIQVTEISGRRFRLDRGTAKNGTATAT